MPVNHKGVDGGKVFVLHDTKGSLNDGQRYDETPVLSSYKTGAQLGVSGALFLYV